jgi:hypothetical protein
MHASEVGYSNPHKRLARVLQHADGTQRPALSKTRLLGCTSSAAGHHCCGSHKQREKNTSQQAFTLDKAAHSALTTIALLVPKTAYSAMLHPKRFTATLLIH